MYHNSTVARTRLSNSGESLKPSFLSTFSLKGETPEGWKRKRLCGRVNSPEYRKNVGDAETKCVSAEPSP
jgi:hypothetical protein